MVAGHVDESTKLLVWTGAGLKANFSVSKDVKEFHANLLKTPSYILEARGSLIDILTN